MAIVKLGDLFKSVPGPSVMGRRYDKIGKTCKSNGCNFLTIPSVNMDRVVFLECQFSLALVLGIWRERRKRNMETRACRKYWVLLVLQGQTASITLCSQYCDVVTRIVTVLWEKWSSYVKDFLVGQLRWCSHKIFSLPTTASLPEKLNWACGQFPETD